MHFSYKLIARPERNKISPPLSRNLFRPDSKRNTNIRVIVGSDEFEDPSSVSGIEPTEIGEAETSDNTGGARSRQKVRGNSANRQTPSTKTRHATISSDSGDDTRRSKRRSYGRRTIVTEESDNDDIVVPPSTLKRQNKNGRLRQFGGSNGFENRSPRKDIADLSFDLREEVPRSTRRGHARRATDAELSDDDVDVDDDDFGVKAPTSTQRKSLRKKALREEGTGSSVRRTLQDTRPEAANPGEELSRSAKRNLGNHTNIKPLDDGDDDEFGTFDSTSRKRTRNDVLREEEELAEDLDYLQSSPVKSPMVKSKSSKAQQAIERLRIQRASQQKSFTPGRNQRRVVIESDEEEIITSSRAMHHAIDPDEEEVDSDEDETDNDVSMNEHTTARDMFEETDEDQDFLASSDSEDALGVPVEMPFQFSSHARMKPKIAFQVVIEWMVQKKINPAFDRKNVKYLTAFRRVDDEAQALVGSKYVSSIWRPDFTIALRARPDISVWEEIGIDRGLKNCEACNRKSHPATFNIQFTGNPYHSDTLEEVEQDTDSDTGGMEQSHGDENRVLSDSNGLTIAPSNTTYAVGRHCKANAETGHKLQHWKVHLFTWVVDHLRTIGELTAEKIVERDGWKDEKRRKDADRIADEMVQDGTVDKLHSEYTTEVGAARESKASFGSTELPEQQLDANSFLLGFQQGISGKRWV